MTPEAALARQIEPYRRMTGEQRLKIALDLHEFACEIARDHVFFERGHSWQRNKLRPDYDRMMRFDDALQMIRPTGRFDREQQ